MSINVAVRMSVAVLLLIAVSLHFVSATPPIQTCADVDANGDLLIWSNVTTIATNQFADCAKLKTVQFDTNSIIEEIGIHAFHSSGLEFIHLPRTLLYIQFAAFHSCAHLKNVTFDEPANIIALSNSTFMFSGIEHITIPASVITIDTSAFKSCMSLKTVEFTPSSHLEAIDTNAFAGCQALVTIEVPDKVTLIGSQAFYDTPSFLSMTFQGDSSLTTIGKQAFASAGSGCGLTGTLNLPPSLLIVGASAFFSCQSLTQVVWGTNPQLTTIQNMAFSQSGLIGTIMLPPSLEYINTKAFFRCKHLNYVNFGINSQLKLIGQQAFYQSTLIGTIYIPTSVTFIGTYAFNGNTNLTQVDFTCGSSAAISSGAFTNTGLITLSLPTAAHCNGCGVSVQPLYMCQTCSDVDVNGNLVIWANVTNIPSYAFTRCINLKKLSFESGSLITSIGEQAFSQSGLQEIDIPSSVTDIQKEAFHSCYSLKAVNFAVPSGLSKLGNNTFIFSALETITIPPEILVIDTGAFQSCTQLKTVQFSFKSQLTTIDSKAFAGCVSLNNVIVPNTVTIIGAESFYQTPNMTTFSFHNVTQSELQIIGKQSFAQSGIKSILTLPKSLTVIDQGAFLSCHQLLSVRFLEPSLLNTISNSAFSRSGLAGTLLIPDSVTTIETKAFMQCKSMSSVQFSSNSKLVNIGNQAFYQTGISETVNIPSKVAVIGIQAFSQDKNLTNVIFTCGMTTQINSGAFSNSNISSIYIPAGVVCNGCGVNTTNLANCSDPNPPKPPDGGNTSGKDTATGSAGKIALGVIGGLITVGFLIYFYQLKIKGNNGDDLTMMNENDGLSPLHSKDDL